MLNRKTAPLRQIPDKIKIAKAEDIVLPNGVRLLTINAGSEDVCKMDLNFLAGSRYQKKAVESRATMAMLTEGTPNLTSHQIAEKFDFYGSFCEHASDRDFSKTSLFSLNKFLKESLNLLEQVVKYPIFPEKEIETYRIKGKQSLIVELEKVSTLARQDFFKGLFGASHPYGTCALPEDYINLQRNDLVNFHQKQLTSKLCTIVLSGRIGKNEIDNVIKYFGTTSWGNESTKLDSFPRVFNASKRKYFSFREDALQSAIRIGKQLVDRKHPDYSALVVLNTILGGYFGSRLMKNIREEKGYTYGISSSILTLKELCVFVIGTEVGTEFTLPALKEIYFEISRLRNELVSEDELDLVRNYLLGELLRSFDGAFAIAESVTSLYEYNDLDYTFFEKTIQTIKTITPEQIMNLANHYLREEDFIECVAGSCSNLN
jgi:zinc protease